ncbi:MAG: molybdopterin-dependent oxidoreductase [Deltaproteobacteria bacterium]|nr:molybdopterin-dependent oxidoreductase [Deltaproteobacteria bacterium]
MIKKTVCARDCYDTCSLLAHLDADRRITKIQGDPGHPLTRGLTCPRSAKDHVRLLNNRVDTPCIRNDSVLNPCTWETATAHIAGKLRTALNDHGPQRVLFLQYAGNTGLLTYSYPQRLWRALGATFSDGALCSKSGHTGLAYHYGSSYGLDPLELPRMQLIVFWGHNAAVSSPHLFSLARQARRQAGARIVVVDPIETLTAGKADLWIRVRPGSDVALAYGVINRLIADQGIDETFVTNRTTGFDALKRAAGKWDPGRVARFCGVEPDKLKALSDLYKRLRPAATMIGFGLQKRSGGADQARAVAFIPALLGAERGFFYGNGGAYDVDMPSLKGERQATVPAGSVSQVALADELDSGRFKFVFVSGMNPALTIPNLQAFDRGVGRDDLFLAVHETHWTRTARMADAVLPAPTFLEKDDLIISDTHPLVSFSKSVIDPVNDSRSEIWVMQTLAEKLRLGEDWLYQDPVDALQEVMANAFESGCFQDLLKGRRLRFKRLPPGEYRTPSGKIEFWSTMAEEAGHAPLPRQAELPSGDASFTYITSAVPEYTHTQFQEVYGPIPAVVDIHPRTASRLNIEAGQRVALKSAVGSIVLKARLSERVPEDVLWSPREMLDLDGRPQNRIVDGTPQAIGSGPRFNATRVVLERVDTSESRSPSSFR